MFNLRLIHYIHLQVRPNSALIGLLTLGVSARGLLQPVFSVFVCLSVPAQHHHGRSGAVLSGLCEDVSALLPVSAVQHQRAAVVLQPCRERHRVLCDRLCAAAALAPAPGPHHSAGPHTGTTPAVCLKHHCRNISVQHPQCAKVTIQLCSSVPQVQLLLLLLLLCVSFLCIVFVFIVHNNSSGCT